MKAKNNTPTTAILILFLLFSLFVTVEPVHAACSGPLYVNAASSSGSPNGCSWGTAFPKLQDALAIAGSGDQIWVAAGTYYPDEGAGQTNDSRDSTFRLINGVSVYGGFAGTETLLSQRNTSANVTILSGDIGTLGLNTDNAYHVVQAVTISSTTVLDGFTVQDGYADGGSVLGDFGGGMYINSSNGSLQISGTTFQNNFAGNGGGMATFVSNTHLSKLTFKNNTARQFGGGLYNQDGSPVLLDVIFDNNQTEQPISPGGGMHSTNTNSVLYTVAPSLTNVTFSNNKALLGGAGGMFNFESHAILTNVTFSGNSAYLRGGAMLNEGSNPVLNNVTFSGNTAPAGTGGAIRNIYASDTVPSNPVIHNTILWGNGSEEIATEAGSTVTITDSVVQGGCPSLGTCTNLKTTTPNLSALASNSGFTQTMALGAGSSALDTGGVSYACASTDQRGVNRPQGSACDMGAYEYDGPAFPAVTVSLATGQANSTNTSPINFTVVFSVAVNDFVTGDITPTGTAGAKTATITEVPPNNGTTYNVAVSDMTGDGTVIVTVPAGVATNQGAGNSPSDNSQSGGNVVSYDTSLPSVTVNRAASQANPANTSPVNFTVVFSEAVTGFVTGDITPTGTAGATTATITEIAPNNGTTYNVAVSGMSKNGTVIVTIPAGVATDLAQNSNNPSTSTDNTVTYKMNNPDTVGVFRPSNGVLFLKNTNATGYADIAINYGMGGDYPIAGDWDGNGTATIGIYRNGYFYLRNANTIGYADVYFPFGTPGDQPIAGDWDGDGVDTIGVYNSQTITFYLRNSNSAGPADYTFRLGIPGDVGIAGDWTNKGYDTVGVFRPSNGVIFLKNTNQTGYADIAINYGIGGDKPVTGDWDGNGTDTIGVLRGNTFYLRNSNTVGYADMYFALGIPGDMPIAGNWDGIP